MFDKFCGCDLRDGEVCLDGANRSRLGSVLVLRKNTSLLSHPPNPTTLASQQGSEKFAAGKGEINFHPYFGACFRHPSFVFLAVRVIRLASGKVAYVLGVFFLTSMPVAHIS